MSWLVFKPRLKLDLLDAPKEPAAARFYKMKDLKIHRQSELACVSPVSSQCVASLAYTNGKPHFRGAPMNTVFIHQSDLMRETSVGCKAFIVILDPRRFPDCLGKRLFPGIEDFIAEFDEASLHFFQIRFEFRGESEG